MRIPVFALLMLATVGGAPAASAGVTLYRFARLVDGDGKLLSAHQVAVDADSGRITAVGDNLAARYPAAPARDLRPLTGLPGLIDVHTHITYALPAPARGNAWAELEAAAPADILAAATENAKKALLAGITSVRDLNAEGGLDFYLRALINRGIIIGPRIFAAGEGIHPSRFKPPLTDKTRLARVVEFATRQHDAGADWIKFFATSGSADDLTAKQLFFYPEMKAVADLAHGWGMRVAVHAYGPAAVPDAIRAGVDSIDHPVGLGAAGFRAMAAAGIVYVPTIDHNRYYADHAAEYGYDAKTVRSLHDFVKRNVESLRLALDAGVRVAMGSDALMSGFGDNARELTWFVRAGMTPGAAIAAATGNGAALLGQEDNLGRIAPGYRADIIAVDGNPLADITALTGNIAWVMKNGTVVTGVAAKDGVRKPSGRR